MPDDFKVIKVDLLYAIVCSSLTPEETTVRLNNVEPTGISSRWGIGSPVLPDEGSNPRPCDKYPETHKHYLFNC